MPGLPGPAAAARGPRSAPRSPRSSRSPSARPCARSRGRAATPRRPRAAPPSTSWSSSARGSRTSPQRLWWNSFKRSSTWAVIAPDRLAVALGEEVLGLAVLEVGVELAVEEEAPLQLQRRHPGVSRWRRKGTLTKRLRSRRLRDRPDRHACHREPEPTLSGDERDREGARRRLREGAQPRPARAARSRQGARPPPLLPPARPRRPARWSRWRAGRRSCSAPTTTSG